MGGILVGVFIGVLGTLFAEMVVFMIANDEDGFIQKRKGKK